MSGEQFEFVRGDTIIFTITCARPDAAGVSQLVDLTDADITCSVKLEYRDDDDDALVQVTTPYTGTHGINILDQTSNKGQAQVIIAPEDTEAAEADADYYIDVQLVESNGRVSTPVDGIIHFKADVTLAAP